MQEKMIHKSNPVQSQVVGAQPPRLSLMMSAQPGTQGSPNLKQCQDINSSV